MPIVPATRGPSVNPAPLPGVRVSPEAPLEAFGGGQANQRVELGGVNELARTIFEDEKRKADQTAVLNAAGQASDLETALTIKTKQRFGQDAFNAPTDVADEWNTAMGDIEQGLTNDTQRRSFAQIKASHWHELNASVQMHVATERQKFNAQVTDTYLGAELNAALAAGTPERVSLANDNRAAAITDHLRQLYHGQVPPGVLDAATTQATSELTVAYIRQLVDQRQMLTARDYLATHRDQILGSQIGDVDKLVKTGSVLGQAQTVFDRLIRTATDEKSAVDEVRKEQDPEVRQQAEALIRQEFAERKNEALALKRQLYQQASDAVDKRGRLTDIAPSIWAQLTLAERSDLRRYSQQITEGTPIKTDLGVFYDLRKMAANPDSQAAFVKLDLNRYRGQLSEGDFKSMVELQQGVVKKDQATTDKLHGIRTNDQIVTDAIHAIGLGIYLNQRKEDDQKINIIHRSIDAQVEAEQQRTGKPVTAADVQRITDEILTQHVVSSPGWLYGRNQTSKRIFDVGPNDDLVLSVSDIPLRDRQALTQQLRARGLPVTNEILVDQYRKYLMGMVRRGPE